MTTKSAPVRLSDLPVQEKVRQTLTFQRDTGSITIRNLTGRLLSTDERLAIEGACHTVAAFTRERIVQRLEGIDLVDMGEALQWGGTYNPYSRVVRVNLAGLRRLKKPDLGDYAPYFTGRPGVSLFDLTLAHEMAHAMDIGTLAEAVSLGIDIKHHAWFAINGRTNSFSYFQQGLGWRHRVIGDGKLAHNTWRLEEKDKALAPTRFAAEMPHEDFAETFAIMALGGDTSMFTNRAQLLRSLIQPAS
ncbi:hypothetical protein JNJ66_01340 [Candidatus Saccharibacteria bacterium]|nr:hypothetical protein [Candidatus Saccharibacteria bacterium]